MSVAALIMAYETAIALIGIFTTLLFMMSLITIFLVVSLASRLKSISEHLNELGKQMVGLRHGQSTRYDRRYASHKRRSNERRLSFTRTGNELSPSPRALSTMN